MIPILKSLFGVGNSGPVNKPAGAGTPGKDRVDRIAAQKIRKVIGDKGQNSLTALIALFCNHLAVVDSNIWMDEDYDLVFGNSPRDDSPDLMLSVFGWLQKQGFAQFFGPLVRVPAGQFEEICIAKEKAKTAPDKPESGRPRLALRRLERWQATGMVQIDTPEPDEKLDTYGDRVLLKMAVSSLRRGQSVRFVTDDVGLRIRVRSAFEKENRPCQGEIVSAKEIVRLGSDIREAVMHGVAPSFHKAIKRLEAPIRTKAKTAKS